jgi:hypothetical protein
VVVTGLRPDGQTTDDDLVGWAVARKV